MAIVKYYSIHDSDLGFFEQCLPTRNDADAMRQIANNINGGKGNLAKYPEKFNLFHMFDIDDESGIVTQKQPRLVCNCSSLIESKERESNNGKN